MLVTHSNTATLQFIPWQEGSLYNQVVSPFMIKSDDRELIELDIVLFTKLII